MSAATSQGKDSAAESVLYIAVELNDKQWKLTVGRWREMATRDG
jgi:hypothetical protein